MTVYYPLAVGNTWTYKMKDGKTFTNKVVSAKGNEFTMTTSIGDLSAIVRKDGDAYVTNSFEPGKFLPIIKDNLKPGDQWEIRFTVNNINSVLVTTVKEVGMSKEVEGTTYTGVVMLEAESKMDLNGNIMQLNFFTQYYYADGIGLILTTSSVGDFMGLISHEIH